MLESSCDYYKQVVNRRDLVKKQISQIFRYHANIRTEEKQQIEAEWQMYKRVSSKVMHHI
jgi:hypothetical protein